MEEAGRILIGYRRRQEEEWMSEHTWTKVAEGKCIKKRPNDNYNNQSFEKELAMRNEMDNEEKIKDSKI